MLLANVRLLVVYVHLEIHFYPSLPKFCRPDFIWQILNVSYQTALL